MVHIDVKHPHPLEPHGDVLVQTSIDGGPWKTQYVVTSTVGTESQSLSWRVQEAEDTARIFMAGCRFAGAECRGTSGGYTL